MKTRTVLVAIAAILLLGGCAGPKYLDKKNEELRPLLAAGKFDMAIAVARSDFNFDDSDSSMIRKELAKYPGTASAFGSRLRSEIAAEKDPRTFLPLFKAIEFAQRDGVISAADSITLLGELTRRVESGHRSGQIPFDFSNAEIFDSLPALKSKESEIILFQRSLSNISTSKTIYRDMLIDRCVAFAKLSGRDSRADVELRQKMPALGLTTAELRRVVVPYDQAFGERLIEARVVKLLVKSEPNDRLLEEDIKELLQKRNGDVTFVTARADDATVLIVGKLQYEERSIPERKETITYQQYEVNLLGAVLLMPRNASYMYEHVTGGHDVSWAYLIKIERRGNVVSDKVFRDRASKIFNTCENARIVNVFGGIQKAEFVANQDMVNRCNGSAQRPDPGEIRSEIMERVADQILSQLVQ